MSTFEIPTGYDDYLTWQHAREPYVEAVKRYFMSDDDSASERDKQAVTARKLGIEPPELTQVKHGRLTAGVVAKIQTALDVPYPYLPANPEYDVPRPLTLDWFRREWLDTPTDTNVYARDAKVRGEKYTGPWETYRVAQFNHARHLQPFYCGRVPRVPETEFSLHPGQELVLVLEGSVELEYWGITAEKKVANRGEVLFFDASHPHRIGATTDDGAKALFVLSSPNGIAYEACAARFPTPGATAHLGFADQDGPTVFRDSRAKLTINPPDAGTPVENTLTARLIAAVLAHPCWKGIARAAGLSKNQLEGSAQIKWPTAQKIASLLGFASMEPLLRPLSMSEMALTAAVEDPDPVEHGREERENWERISHWQAIHLLKHLQYANLFRKEEILTRQGRLYPHLLTVTSAAEVPYVEEHAFGDDALEFVYVYDGPVDVELRRRGTPDLVRGRFQTGDCVLFESEWVHGWGCADGNPARLLLCYYSYWGGLRSYKHPEQVSGLPINGR